VELHRNTANCMTKWLVARGILTSPFVLVDVGVQGGISPRWDALGDHLVVYGFDLLEEAIAPLADAKNKRSHFFPIGLADHDGEVEIVVPSDPYETQLNSSGPGERRRIQVRRLDTLLDEQRIQPADFIKLDCEGYEPIALRGASAYLSASNLVGADVESSFSISPTLPNTQLLETTDPLVRQRLLIFDIAFNRVPVVPSLLGQSIHRPATLNVLFARNLVQETDSPESYIYRPPEQPANPQTILKSAIVFEAYGLLDWACFVLKRFSSEIGTTVDVDEAIAKLTSAPNLRDVQARGPTGELLPSLDSVPGRDLAHEFGQRLWRRLGLQR
jgi:FkbM family methyltransferase